MSLTHPRLFGRSGSHFTRLARMVALEAGVEAEFHVTPLRSLDPSDYGGHPALKLPALVSEEGAVFGTVAICRRLVEASPTGFALTWPEAMSPALQTAWELLSQAMLTQVQLVFGVSVNGLPADHPYFVKAARGLEGAMAWLDAGLPELLPQLPEGLSLFELALFCQLEHLRFRPSVLPKPSTTLEAFRASLAGRPSALATPFLLDPPGQTP